MHNQTFKTHRDFLIWQFLELKAAEKGWVKEKQIADAIGIHPQYLSAIKRGLRSFGPVVIRRICQKLNATEKQIFSENSQPVDECDSLREQLKEWKKIAASWERQYYELKKRLD